MTILALWPGLIWGTANFGVGFATWKCFLDIWGTWYSYHWLLRSTYWELSLLLAYSMKRKHSRLLQILLKWKPYSMLHWKCSSRFVPLVSLLSELKQYNFLLFLFKGSFCIHFASGWKPEVRGEWVDGKQVSDSFLWLWNQEQEVHNMGLNCWYLD